MMSINYLKISLIRKILNLAVDRSFFSFYDKTNLFDEWSDGNE